MNGKIEFELKPVSGVAAGGGGYRAILTTAKGESVDIDGVITEAREHGYLMGIKDEAAKSRSTGASSRTIPTAMTAALSDCSCPGACDLSLIR